MTVKKKTNGRKAPGMGLARPGDPLVSATGERLEPIGGKPISKKEQAQQGVIDPAEYRPMKKRSIKELPAEVNITNAVSVVFMYTMLGLGDREIAETLKTSVDDIQGLRQHSAYGECFSAIHSEFISANSELLTSRIAAYSQTALKTVGNLITEGRKEEVRLRASIDMLDRAGVRPKDQDHKANQQQSHLRIIIVDGDKTTNVQVDMGDDNGDRS